MESKAPSAHSWHASTFAWIMNHTVIVGLAHDTDLSLYSSYVCIYARTCVCIHTHTFMCMCICRIYVYTRKHNHIHKYEHTCIHACMLHTYWQTIRPTDWQTDIRTWTCRKALKRPWGEPHHATPTPKTRGALGPASVNHSGFDPTPCNP